MIMLRTPKDLTGPDLGVGSLTFRAFYEAQHGADSRSRDAHGNAKPQEQADDGKQTPERSQQPVCCV